MSERTGIAHPSNVKAKNKAAILEHIAQAIDNDSCVIDVQVGMVRCEDGNGSWASVPTTGRTITIRLNGGAHSYAL